MYTTSSRNCSQVDIDDASAAPTKPIPAHSSHASLHKLVQQHRYDVHYSTLATNVAQKRL